VTYSTNNIVKAQMGLCAEKRHACNVSALALSLAEGLLMLIDNVDIVISYTGHSLYKYDRYPSWVSSGYFCIDI